MLERARLRHIVVGILRDKVGQLQFENKNVDVAIYNGSDKPLDTQNEPLAINVKTLSQNGNNQSTAADNPLVESVISLHVIVFVASNVESWPDILDGICEKVQWALLTTRDFLTFGRIESFNTTIDDGTGDSAEMRAGGALMQFNIAINEIPDPELQIHATDFFKTMHNTFKINDGASVLQTTTLPGPFPGDNEGDL